jgi:membrane protein involved in colicin uptake
VPIKLKIDCSGQEHLVLVDENTLKTELANHCNQGEKILAALGDRKAKCYQLVSLIEEKDIGELLKFFNLEQKHIVTLAADYAERVLSIFEEKYPNNSKPREAIASVRKWVRHPTKANKNAAAADARAAAATAAAAAADAADDADAAWAARAAAWAARDAAATADAYAADAAWAARAAAWAAAWAVAAADKEAEKRWQIIHTLKAVSAIQLKLNNYLKF